MRENTGKRVVITGSNRGLGLAFTRLWLQDGAAVCALARTAPASGPLAELEERHPGSLHRIECDVADDASVRAAAEAVSGTFDGVDVLVNNAGTYGPRGGSLADLDHDAVRQVFEVNTLGPLRVTAALLSALRRGHAPRVASVTSLMGSMGDNTSGGSYPYRISKAALNMAGRNMAHDLAGDGIIAIVMHPGWVQTEMGGAGAPLAIDDAVAAMIRTIKSLTPDRSGSFLDRDGQRLPW